MTLTRKLIRVAVSAANPVEDILASNTKRVTICKKGNLQDGDSDSKKRKKTIAEWTVRPPKSVSCNEDKEVEGKKEDVGAHLGSAKEGSPADEDDEVHEEDWEDVRI